MIFKELKEQTQLLHEEAEKYNDAFKVINHNISLPDYKELLLINYGSYQPVEKCINAHRTLLPEELKEFAWYHKSDRITKDLEFFDNDVQDVELLEFDVTVASAEHLIGMMYVLEGSMMGGLVISKHVSKCPLLHHIPEQLFFNREVEATLSRWSRFKAAVEKRDYTKTQIAQAVMAANKTFSFFKEVHIHHKQLF